MIWFYIAVYVVIAIVVYVVAIAYSDDPDDNTLELFGATYWPIAIILHILMYFFKAIDRLAKMVRKEIRNE